MSISPAGTHTWLHAAARDVLRDLDGLPMSRGSATRHASAAALVMTLLCGCGLLTEDAGTTTEVAFVAGGGSDPYAVTAEQIRLEGEVRDLAARDGAVHLLATRPRADGGIENYLLRIAEDGMVADLGVEGLPSSEAADLQHLAAGANGILYVAGSQTIYRIEDDIPEPLFTAPDDATIGGLAVGAEGEPIWSEEFHGDTGDPYGSTLVRIRRLADGTPERVAGVDDTTMTSDEITAAESDPPDGTAADAMPLASAGLGGTLAADDDGNVVAASEMRSILRFGAAGTVEAVSRTGKRKAPGRPFEDEGPAADFGGRWRGADSGDLSASGGRIAAIDPAWYGEGDHSWIRNDPDPQAFAWTGDLGAGAQQLADEIVRSRDDESRASFAVVIDDGTAATVADHAAKLALDGDTLYLAGQSSRSLHEAEILLVSVRLYEG